MRRSIREHGVLATGCAVALLIGAAAGFALAPSHTRDRTVTVPRTVIETVTRNTPATRVKTVTEAAPAPARRAASDAKKAAPAVPPVVTATPAGAGRPTRLFQGTGAKRLGTITVSQPGATLRWTNRGGEFRLLYGRSGLAVESRAPAGRFGVPPMTYRDVRVESGGRWTIRLH